MPKQDRKAQVLEGRKVRKEVKIQKSQGQFKKGTFHLK